MNQTSAPKPTIDTRMLTSPRAAFTSSDNAASVAEYRLRMFVATGPCITRNRIGIENAPNAAVTKSAGSFDTPALAIDAPRKPSHTVGSRIADHAVQKTFLSETLGFTNRVESDDQVRQVMPHPTPIAVISCVIAVTLFAPCAVE